MNANPLKDPVESVQGSFDLVTAKLQTWLETAMSLLPNLVVALLILIAAALLSRLVRAATRRFLRKVVSAPAIVQLLSTLAGLATIVIGVFVALSAMQLDKTVTSLLAGAGVVGLALAFAFQDLAANLIAGIYMSFKRPLAIGDLVETNDTFGTVESIDLRHTVLRTPQGQAVMLPNKEVFENKLTNYSRRGERRVDLPVGVSYGDDLDKVKRVAVEAIEGLEERRKDRDVELFFEGFGGSSIDLVVRFWIDFERQADYKRARSAAIQAIKKAFDQHDVTIPFPIRTLDFGIRGGVALGEALPLAAEQREQPMEFSVPS